MTDTCRMEEISHMIVVDQGSRASPPLVETDTKVLIIDHHQSDSFPKRATVVNACNHHPVATSSLLTYTICSPLHPDVMPKTAWLAVLGIFGDLGVQAMRANLAPPYPEELLLAKKIYRTTHLSNLVALINAPRRTPECNTADAWKLLQHTPDTDPPPTPKRILDGEVNKELLEKLQDARARVKAEIQRCAHTPPTFSKDKRVAVVYIESRYQVHGVIATRWARSLQSNDLEVVIAANGGYVDGKVNFSCRVVRERRVAEGEEEGVNIIEMLKEYAGKDPWVRDNVGADFANGHKEATGGSVRRDVWEAFVEKGLELEMRKTKSKKKE